MKFDVEMSTCKEGVDVPVPFAGPQTIVKMVKRAEDLGFWAVWGTDFIVPTPFRAIPDKEPPNWYELLISLTYTAAYTKKIKLGAGVVMIPLRDTIILAKQVATIDQFSGGRFLFGVGLGTNREEFEYVRPRDSKANRGQMMDEHMEALHMLLSHQQKELSYKGKYVEFANVNLNPKPLQNPLPVYMPGHNEQALRRIAKWGSGIMVPQHTVKQTLDALKPILEEHGRKLSDIDFIAEGQQRIAKTHDKAMEEFKKSRLGYKRRKLDPTKFAQENWLGTASEVAEKIIKVKKMGIDHFLSIHIAADTPEDLMEQFQILAEEVIPVVKAA